MAFAYSQCVGRQRGFTEFISVGKAWRRQGLARALVVRALHAQKAAGMNESALGVDGESVFSAARLYEACGFRIARRNALYRKPVDLATTRCRGAGRSGQPSAAAAWQAAARAACAPFPAAG